MTEVQSMVSVKMGTYKFFIKNVQVIRYLTKFTKVKVIIF